MAHPHSLPSRFSATPLAAALALLCANGVQAQQAASGTSLTIYSTTAPGAVPAELYRPLPGQGNIYNGQSVPGYAMVRQQHEFALERGTNRLDLTDVAAYIDPTTVMFESLTSPTGTRVIEQSFQFDLVSTDKLMERYLDQTITVDQLSGTGTTPISGKLLSAQGGLVLTTADGAIHALTNYQNVHFPSLPGGLKTRPTLVWDVQAERAGRENTRITYQTSGITWWADYNLTFAPGRDANNGFLDVGAWVSILNRSGASYEDAALKLIAGDVNRAQPQPDPRFRMRAQEMLVAADSAGFAEQSFFEFHLYTLGRTTTIADNSTKQIELFPQVQRVPAKKLLVYASAPTLFGGPFLEPDYGTTNAKVDVFLQFDNRETVGLGIPLPAGRVRVSQEDGDTLEFIGEDTIGHTPKDETVLIRLGSAFDVVGERKQVDFQIDTRARRIDETIEIRVRNHKDEPVDVVVRENLFRFATNDVVEASQRYERKDASTVEFPLQIARDGEAVVRYRVRYDW
jgi:hypothetical protein